MKIGDTYYEKHTVVDISERTNTVSETDVERVNMLPIEDCISRQAVLNLPKRTMKNYFGEAAGEVVDVKDIMELPSVMPKEPKIGHWITNRTIMHDGEFYCDICDNDAPFNNIFHYCPNCGAKMESAGSKEMSKIEKAKE